MISVGRVGAVLAGRARMNQKTCAAIRDRRRPHPQSKEFVMTDLSGALCRAAVVVLAAGCAFMPSAMAAQTAKADASAQRPGPDILYAPPAFAPQLQNTGPWVAPPILVSGAAEYDQGEYLYQDYLHDDRGGGGNPDTFDPQGSIYSFSPKAGGVTYPTNPVYANNAADLVEFRTKPLPDETAFRFTLNTVQDPELVAFTLAIGTSDRIHEWPAHAGVWSSSAYFLTVHGGTAQLTDGATGAVITPAPTVRVDQTRRQFDVRIPHTAWNPGGSTVRMSAGVGLWDTAAGQYLVPGGTATATKPGGKPGSGSGLFNLAFRFTEPMPKVSDLGGLDALASLAAFKKIPSFWREQNQAQALASGDGGKFFADIDFGKLAARVHDDSGVPKTGPMNRILASHFAYGQGIDYSEKCGRFPKNCQGIIRGQLQPYAIYVPSEPQPAAGWGTTLLLHALSSNHNVYLGASYQAQLGDRGQALVVTPGGRGPDGDYRDITEADVFETWADVARHYAVDSRHATVSGFSMGGGGTFRLLERYPDLFTAGAGVAAVPDSGTDAEGPNLVSLRNTPVMTWIGDGDQGTWPPRQRQSRKAQGDLGLRFAFDIFKGADHLTLATREDWTPLVEFLAGAGGSDPNPNPPHVIYSVDPRSDSTAGGAVADHAYWLSKLTVRDTRQDTGLINARSAAFGAGYPTPSGVSTSTRSLPGVRGPLEYEHSEQTWGPAPSTTPENSLAVTLTNIGQATIDGARAKLVGSAPLTLRITSDGPTTITLALTLPPGTTVTTSDGTQTAPAVIGTAGVTISVGPGTGTYTVTPPR
jgi:pimeloyl-ACP methyl ester carboxylesterase